MSKLLTREQWIKRVYELLCKCQGPPKDATDEMHMTEWAEALAETFYDDEEWRVTPEDAVQEELEAGL